MFLLLLEVMSVTSEQHGHFARGTNLQWPLAVVIIIKSFSKHTERQGPISVGTMCLVDRWRFVC